MLDFMFTKKIAKAKCIALYTFEFNNNDSKTLFDFLVSYFNNRYRVKFGFAGFYDQKYIDKYGSLNVVYSKFISHDSNKIVNFSLDEEDMRKKKRTIGVEFNITRPVHLTLFTPIEFSFDLKDFIENIYHLFKVIYGFSYSVTSLDWITAYAIGDWQHSKNVEGVSRLKKEQIEVWKANCEKIQDGYLRDIYLENIISQFHLKRLINGRTVKEHIIDSNSGVLEKINDELFHWKINNEQLDSVRNYFYNSEIII